VDTIGHHKLHLAMLNVRAMTPAIREDRASTTGDKLDDVLVIPQRLKGVAPAALGRYYCFR
jgi:hypothetical protein